jgi:hypothetical protein
MSKGAEKGLLGSTLPMSIIATDSFHFSKARTTNGMTVPAPTSPDRSKETIAKTGCSFALAIRLLDCDPAGDCVGNAVGMGALAVAADCFPFLFLFLLLLNLRSFRFRADSFIWLHRSSSGCTHLYGVISRSSVQLDHMHGWQLLTLTECQKPPAQLRRSLSLNSQ